jgi:hypothetical protein
MSLTIPEKLVRTKYKIQNREDVFYCKGFVRVYRKLYPVDDANEIILSIQVSGKELLNVSLRLLKES